MINEPTFVECLEKYSVFRTVVSEGSLGKTAKFWLSYADHVWLVLSLNLAVKTNDYFLYGSCLFQMADLFFSFDGQNYARFLTFFSVFITNIEETHPGWGKQKETLMSTYKAVMRPALEYASSVWSPIASSTSINKLQVMQNAALRTATGCIQDTNIQHLHYKILTLPIHEHLKLHASQYKQKTQHPSHPLHKHTTYFNTPRLKNPTIFNNGRYTTNIPTDPHTVTTTDIKTNMRHIHTSIVSMHLATRGNNKILRTPPPHTSSSEERLPRLTRRTLAQLRTNKSPFFKSYLHKVDAKTHPSPLCPLYNIHIHDTHHLFN